MVRFSAVLFAMAVAIALVPAPASGKAGGVVSLVNACRQEALRGHMRVGRLLPVMGPQVDSHRERMIAICEGWRATSGEASAALLTQCLNEAAMGPRVLHNGRDLDRDHVARQKKLCRELSAAVAK